MNKSEKKTDNFLHLPKKYLSYIYQRNPCQRLKLRHNLQKGKNMENVSVAAVNVENNLMEKLRGKQLYLCAREHM